MCALVVNFLCDSKVHNFLSLLRVIWKTMDFRAKLIAGLEERKLQDERDKENSAAYINPKTTSNKFPSGDYNKNYKNKNNSYHAPTIDNVNTNNSTNTNNFKNKPGKNNAGKQGKPEKNSNGGFIKQTKKSSNERVIFEGLARIAFFSDKKHYQALRSLAFYCGPEAFAALSCTCSSFESVRPVFLSTLML